MRGIQGNREQDPMAVDEPTEDPMIPDQGAPNPTQDSEGTTHFYEYPAGIAKQVKAPARKIVKGQVKELVAPRVLNVPDPIRAMQGQERFDITKIMDLDVTLPLGQLLNESDQLRKEIAHGMQSSKARYRLKRPTNQTPPVIANAVVNTRRENGGIGVFPPHITTRA